MRPSNFVKIGMIIGSIIFVSLNTIHAGSEQVLAKVGNVVFTQADLDRKLEEIPVYARTNFLTQEGQQKLLDRMVRTELLYQAAMANKYDQEPVIQLKLEDARRRILTSEYFKNEMSKSPEPEISEVMAYYKDHSDEFKIEASAQVRHIQLETKEKALDVKKKIDAGETTFGQAVVDYSKDFDSKNNNGRLGTIRKNGFIRGVGQSDTFEAAIFSMEPGVLSQPVKSRVGWHLLFVDSIVQPGIQHLDDVKDQIVQELMVTDADVEKEYKDFPDNYMSRAHCKIRHIQLETEVEANEVYSLLKDGADFDDLVAKRSIDQPSVKQNGSLGFLYKDGYIRGVGKDPNFEASVFALEVGQITHPIQTRKGWHIVKLDEKVVASKKPLSEVKAQIRNKLSRDFKENSLDRKFENLRKQFNCEVYESRIQSK